MENEKMKNQETKNLSEYATRTGLEQFAGIKVVGVGGAGCNAVSRMIQVGLKGVEFIAINTDAQALFLCDADQRIHIGGNITKGLGAGSDPGIGRSAIEENADDVMRSLEGADMVFIAAGMGGGTGTGAAPVVAELAKQSGALTVAVVTKPFVFEGKVRQIVSERGIEDLQQKVDTTIVIPNDRLLQVVEKTTSLIDSFRIADDVLRQGVQGISDLITIPGLINLDFADIQTVMTGAGSALMGIGTGSGENRAIEAARMAVASPLLETSVDGARGVLFNITGGKDLSLTEVNEAAEVISQAVDPEARIIFGAVVDEKMEEEVKVIVLATGFLTPNGKEQAKGFSDLKEQLTVQPVSAGELDIPAFLRKK